MVDLLNALGEKGLLDGEQGRQDVVVHVHDQVKVAGLAAINIHLLENGGSSLGDLDVKKLQVLDFTKEADKDWVEVYSQESFRGNWSFLSNEKVLI